MPGKSLCCVIWSYAHLEQTKACLADESFNTALDTDLCYSLSFVLPLPLLQLATIQVLAYKDVYAQKW